MYHRHRLPSRSMNCIPVNHKGTAETLTFRAFPRIGCSTGFLAASRLFGAFASLTGSCPFGIDLDERAANLRTSAGHDQKQAVRSFKTVPVAIQVDHLAAA